MLIYLLANIDIHIHEFLDAQMDDTFFTKRFDQGTCVWCICICSWICFSSIVVFDQMEVLFFGAS